MARKSRKKYEIENVQTEQPVAQLKCGIRTAAYVRLSVEQDDGKDSIETQLLMIHQYVEDHPEFEIIDTYQDDGYSGTNFNRPDFTRLMNDIRIGRVQCVIVKDLSRFGRNFVETGYYIETVFPKLNARLIAINDKFDSDREDDRRSLEIPIKNMVNAMYAIDASKKRSAEFEMKSRMGICKIGHGTFGYVVDRENNCLVEYPETSRIVKAIFRWFINGLSMADIARRLNQAGLKTPGQYKEILEGVTNNSKQPEWRSLVVADILRNATYTGDTIQGTKRKRLYKNENIRRVDPNEWIIHANTHAALVSRNDFAIAEELLEQQKTQMKKRLLPAEDARLQTINHFRSKVYCTDCNHTMQFFRYKHYADSESYDGAYYICKHQFLSYCNSRIYVDLLKTVVMDQIRSLVNTVIDQKEFAKEIKEGRNYRGIMLSGEKKLIALKKKLADNEKAIESLYKDLTDGVIDADDFRELSQHYSGEKEELQQKIKKQNRENAINEKSIERFIELAESFEEYGSLEEYDQTLVDELIDRIWISKGNRIEVVFKCEDIYNKFCDITQE